MIVNRDLEFHIPELIPYAWAETGYFNFYIPDAGIMGLVYIVHRAGVGATVSDIEIFDRRSHETLGSLYTNMTNHNPRPESASRFSLPNGLSYSATSIRDYEIAFEDDHVGIALRCTSLMEPYDIHDSNMDPMATDDRQAAVENSGFGEAYAAHFDMTVRIVGTLRIGGKNHAIDCVSTMDHSWGPRPETAINAILWLNAHFGEGYSLHGIFSYDRHAPVGAQHEFKHGYALIDGKVRGAKAGAVTTPREGLFPVTTRFALTDIDGRDHHVEGVPVCHHPWMPYGNNLAPLSMMRWAAPGQPAGYGTYMEGFRLNEVRA